MPDEPRLTAGQGRALGKRGRKKWGGWSPESCVAWHCGGDRGTEDGVSWGQQDKLSPGHWRGRDERMGGCCVPTTPGPPGEGSEPSPTGVPVGTGDTEPGRGGTCGNGDGHQWEGGCSAAMLPAALGNQLRTKVIFTPFCLN